jgi:hypothetical protein
MCRILPDQPRRQRRRPGSHPHLIHTRPRRNPQPPQRLRMLFPLTAWPTAPRTSPTRSPAGATWSPNGPAAATERKTKRPGGRYKTRRPGQTARLTPLTTIVFWLMPVPALT